MSFYCISGLNLVHHSINITTFYNFHRSTHLFATLRRTFIDSTCYHEDALGNNIQGYWLWRICDEAYKNVQASRLFFLQEVKKEGVGQKVQ
jgi:hypothetical protein